MYSILIIEDDPLYLAAMEQTLKREGFDIRTASDGETGLAMFRARRPDLVLCDIMMPGMDGHSVLEALKGDNSLADIPFIFVSALGERIDVRRGMSAGADDYLTKPFTPDELLAAIIGRIRRRETILHRQCKPDCKKEQGIIKTKITVRERQVLLMMGRGATSRVIAKRLGVALKTVEAHRANMMKKLNAPNAACLARWAVIAEQIESSPCRVD